MEMPPGKVDFSAWRFQKTPIVPLKDDPAQDKPLERFAVSQKR